MAKRGKLLSCEKCPAQFCAVSELDRHLRQVHEEFRPFLCHLCPAKFSTPDELEAHVDVCATSEQSASASASTTAASSQDKPEISTSQPASSLEKPSEETSSLEKSKPEVDPKQAANRRLLLPKLPGVSFAGAKVIRVPSEFLKSGVQLVQAKGDGQDQKSLIKSAVVSKEVLNQLIGSNFIDKQGLKGVSNPSKSTQNGTLRKTVQKVPMKKNDWIPSIKPSEVVAEDWMKDGAVVENPEPKESNDVTKVKVEPVSEDLVSSSNLRPFLCQTYKCPETFATISELEAHISLVHIITKTIRTKCQLCDIAFCGVDLLKEHVSSFVCPVDAEGQWKGFGSMPSLPPGSVDIMNAKLHEDLQLPNVSELPGLKFEPVQSDPEETGSIVYTDSEEETQIPKDKRLQKKRHVCNVCGKVYRTLDEFTKHYRKHARNELMPPKPGKRPKLQYPCNSCSKSFSNFETLYNHRKIHTGETPYACRYCDSAYIDVHGLEYHMFGSHAWAMNAIKLIRCRVLRPNSAKNGQFAQCLGKFFHLKGFREHCLISHQYLKDTEDFPCSCDCCAKNFESADAMQDHIRYTTCNIRNRLNEWLSETPDALIGCNALYETTEVRVKTPSHKIRNDRATSGMQRELRVVIDRKTKCPRCKKRFASLSFLAHHYSTRCEAKRAPVDDFRRRDSQRLKCDECNLTFWGTHYFERHKEHHLKQSLENSEAVNKRCSLCGLVFESMNEFFEHYRTHGLTSAPRRRRLRRIKPTADQTAQETNQTAMEHEVKNESYEDVNNLLAVQSDHVKTEMEDSVQMENDVSVETENDVPSKIVKTVGEVLMEIESGITEKIKDGDSFKIDKVHIDSENDVKTAKVARSENKNTVSIKTENSDEASRKSPKLIWNAETSEYNTTNVNSDGRTLKFSKSCSLCERTFSSMDKFIEHYRQHESGDCSYSSKRIYCEQCPAQFISMQVYLSHSKIHSSSVPDEMPYKCKFCNEAFRTALNLGLHIPTAHMKEKKFFQVYQTGTDKSAKLFKKVTSIYELKLVLGSGNDGKKADWNCKCLECGDMFYNYKGLKSHILANKCTVTFAEVIVESNGESAQKLLCKICGNLYHGKPQLTNHLEKAHALSAAKETA